MDRDIKQNAVIINTTHSPYTRLKPVSLDNISLFDGFWHTWIKRNTDVTLISQYNLLESTGRLDNFRRLSGKAYKPYRGYVFNDSDVYKWLEAASWALVHRPDSKLQYLVDDVVTLIAEAQDQNGYINTFFSLDRSGERWSNLEKKHELYCAGHLMQAAIAHYRVTGEKRLLDIAIRLADHINFTFSTGKREGTSGHPEIEMALVELFRTTGNDKYLSLASIFLDRRGRRLLGGGEYLIDHLPFRDLEILTGHAVRALYLCSGAADIALETGESVLITTLERLWKNMVERQIYITCGVGARHDGEAFGNPYELPNARAYAETCAAIASVMWNWRMLHMFGNAKFSDLLEWTLYNAVLPGISVDARNYFYVNPLMDAGNHRRKEWFDCACCPPNISRMIAMFPGYMYSVSREGIWLHLYANSIARINLTNGDQLEFKQTSSYPWSANITIEITDLKTKSVAKGGDNESSEHSLFLRIPGWVNTQRVVIIINEKDYPNQVVSGSYVEIHHSWRIGDKVIINLPMDIKYIVSHPYVVENNQRLAITRGPILYCLEQVDNENALLPEIQINTDKLPEAEFDTNLLGGIVKLNIQAKVHPIDSDWEHKLYHPLEITNLDVKDRPINVVAIPYYAWANREPGAMQIWHSYY
jgi:DUF1680 family protein